MLDCTSAQKGPRCPSKGPANSGAARSWLRHEVDQEWAQTDHAAEFQDRWYLTEGERLQDRLQSTPPKKEGDESCLIEEECQQTHRARPMQSLGHKAECFEMTFRRDAEKAKVYNASSLVADLADNATVDGRRPEEMNVNSSDAHILSSKGPLPEAITLAEVFAFTILLKQQIFKLQGEVSEQKQRLASMDQLQDQVIKLQGDVLEHEKQLASGAPQWHCDAAALTVQDQSLLEKTTVPASLTSPKYRLGQMFNRTPSGRQLRSPSRSVSPERSVSPSRRFRQIFDSPTRSNSPNRSNSPSRRLCQMVSSSISQSISRDLGTLMGTKNPSHGTSPERSDSPTRRIVAQLAPRLLSTITGCVDGQIQKLESRLVSMEKLQSAVPGAVADGVQKHPWQKLAGRNIAKSRALSTDDLQMVLGLSSEDLQSCTPPKEMDMVKQQGCRLTPGKKAGSWKHFFRRPKPEC